MGRGRKLNYLSCLKMVKSALVSCPLAAAIRLIIVLLAPPFRMEVKCQAEKAPIELGRICRVWFQFVLCQILIDQSESYGTLERKRTGCKDNCVVTIWLLKNLAFELSDFYLGLWVQWLP